MKGHALCGDIHGTPDDTVTSFDTRAFSLHLVKHAPCIGASPNPCRSC